MVLPRDKGEIENSEVSESAEAEEVEVTLPFVRLFPTWHVPDPEFPRVQANTPPASPNPKGEFQCGEMGSR
jgi:hypothetical protein